MKKLVYIATLTAALSLSACNKWLDVNANPNSAESSIPTAEQRLPAILAQFADGYESAGTRAAFITQQLAMVNGTSNNWNLTRWNITDAAVGWPWQAWYVNTAVNIQPMTEAALKVDAFHYVGVGKIIKAWGFGYLVDCFGILPYDEFDNRDILTPKMDDGAYVYGEILALLDEAIADLSKSQGEFAPALAKGDIYYQGNAQNWIKLAYGLKARFLNHLSKKASYAPDEILTLLAKAPAVPAESATLQYIDETDKTTNTAKAALQWANTGTTARVTKLYYDYLTNKYTGAPKGSSDVEDPRLRLLIPSADNGKGEMILAKPIDMQSPLPATGPTAYTYYAKKNQFANGNADSVYLSLRYDKAANGRVLSTGTWYTKKGAIGLLLTSAEMKFIAAEIRFRKGEPDLALAAYKEGIQQHMQLLGVAESAIHTYLNSSSVVQQSAALTLSHIMIQKYIALSYSQEQWADLRRMDFCTDASGNYNETLGIYKGFNKPSHVFQSSFPNAADWPRRFAVASYEINYNLQKVREADADAGTPRYITKPVWWDTKD